MLDYNNTPLSDCDGFTPLQMHKIIYSPFENDCPIKVNRIKDNQLLHESPILNIAIELLSKLREADLKLTPKGNLPRPFMKDIYNKGFWVDDLIEKGIIKIHAEYDWLILHNIKIVLQQAGLIRKKNNFLSLTKKCETLLKDDNYWEIFYQLLKAFSCNFNWGYNDGFEDKNVGQIGFLYLLHIINKYGAKERDLLYYSDLYFLAFLAFLENNRSDSSRLSLVFHTRFIERFALWFGFVEGEKVKGNNYFDWKINIKRTKLLEQLFKVKSETINC